MRKASSWARAYLCQAWEIDQGQVQDKGRVDLEVDGLAVDALVVTGNACRLVLNLPLDVGEVGEAAVGNVVELCPLGAARRGGRSVRVAGRIRGVVILGDVDELEDQGPPCNDAAAAGQKVATDNVFEDRGLAGTLGSDDNLEDGMSFTRTGVGRKSGRAYNLGQIERVVADGVEDEILQLVDGAEQVVAEGSHGDEGGDKSRRGAKQERARLWEWKAKAEPGMAMRALTRARGRESARRV